MSRANTGGRPVLWGRGDSTNVQKVLFACAELGLAPGRRIVGGPHGGTDTPAFARLNPNRTVPVWQEGDGALWESGAILRHLGRTHGTLYGTADAETARIDQWLDWTVLVFWPPVRSLFLDLWRDGRVAWGDDAARDWAARTEAALRVAAQAVATNGNLAGRAFGLADIAFSIGLNRLAGLPYPIACPDPLDAWLDGVRTRPAFAVATAEEPDLPGHALRRGAGARA